MTPLFEKVRNFVEKSFDDEAQMIHFDRTVYWLRELKPDADEALLIAAIGHDIERGFRDEKSHFDNTKKEFDDPDHLKHHQEEGAEILGGFLQKQGASEDLIAKAQHLISSHEVGGDKDQNLLKDADSLSFLENNAPIFLKRFQKLGYDRIRRKFDWMYERITSQRAKEIGKPFYEKMISDLDNFKARTET